MKLTKKKAIIEQVKASRKQSREEEFRTHGKSINYGNIIKSKKIYSRKKNEADADEALPYSFIVLNNTVYQILTLFSGLTYIVLSFPTLNASYQAAICGNAPFTLHSPIE